MTEIPNELPVGPPPIRSRVAEIANELVKLTIGSNQPSPDGALIAATILALYEEPPDHDRSYMRHPEDRDVPEGYHIEAAGPERPGGVVLVRTSDDEMVARWHEDRWWTPYKQGARVRREEEE